MYYCYIQRIGSISLFQCNLCSFAEHLKKYANVFTFPQDDSVQCGAYLTLNESLTTPEDRTRGVGDVVKCLGEEVIPGTRNEVLLMI